MTTTNEVHNLLRFLTKDAKVPLSIAMGKIKHLQEASLTSTSALAKADISSVQKIFADESLAKQVLSAAKRTNKKRFNNDALSPSPTKLKKTTREEVLITPAAIEESLALPTTSATEAEIAQTTLYTNRAPLMLGFAVMLVQYTMPEQPLSARLSLAQAVVSTNGRSKAVSLGIETGKSAEDEGWGQGQPVIRLMGREIRVMKRWGYDWKTEPQGDEGKNNDNPPDLASGHPLDASTTRDGESIIAAVESCPALWGLDLEARRSSNRTRGPNALPAKPETTLPIHTPQSARSYLLKSFASAAPNSPNSVARKKPAKALEAEKEHNLGLLLGAVDLLYSSWAKSLPHEELDRRSWAWYVAVRPEVPTGAAGWGGKGVVKLSEILALRKKG